MKRGQDYEWASLHTLDTENFVCGHCSAPVSANEGWHGWILDRYLNRHPAFIYICHNCAAPTYFDIDGKQRPKPKPESITFSDHVSTVSPKFVEIYNQAHIAESEGLSEIAGPGYGKALEFLVKDYLIKHFPEQEPEIKSLSLNNCIQQKVENPKIKTLANKARSVRNDETHYERKYEDSDINDLKKLINATASWIDLESYTTEVETN